MDKPLLRKKSKKFNFIIILACCVVLLIFSFIFLIDFDSKLKVDKNTITISNVSNELFQEYILVTGTIEPFKTFYIDATDGGKVMEKYANDGDFLQIGVPIVKLDNPDLTMQLLNTQSSFLQAESQLSLTRITFEQNRMYRENELLDINNKLINQNRIFEANKKLFENKHISIDEFEKSKNDYEYLLKSKELLENLLKKDSITYIELTNQNKDNISRTKEYIALIKSQLDNLTVKAPINGQLTSFNVEKGQALDKGFRLGQIDCVDSFKVKASIDEHYLSRIKKGLSGSFTFNDNKIELTVQTVYPQISNGRFTSDFIFNEEEPNGIRRGQTVHINLNLGDLSKSILIPNGAFFSTTGGKWVYVLDKSGDFAVKRNIKIGRQNPDFFEVTDGLKEGEKVITSSYDSFNNVNKIVF